MAPSRKISTITPLRPPSKASVHPTRDKLLATTVELLKQHLPQSITSEMVLAASGISRGSLYHHFEDFAELLEVALVDAFAASVDLSISALTGALMNAKKKSDLFAGLFKVTEHSQGPELQAVRFHRARLISFSEDNPRLAMALAKEQQRLTDAITDLIREAQARGWMNKQFDARAAAVLIQAYTLGKIVDDVVENSMQPDDWNNLINRLIQKVFG